MNAPASITNTPVRAADVLAAKGQGHASVTAVSDSCQITPTTTTNTDDDSQRERLTSSAPTT